MKQTAVEWLLQKLFETNNNTNDVKKMDINKIIEQAKQMEKQQMIDSISNANKSNNRNVSLNPEQYYNETFNKE